MCTVDNNVDNNIHLTSPLRGAYLCHVRYVHVHSYTFFVVLDGSSCRSSRLYPGMWPGNKCIVVEKFHCIFNTLKGESVEEDALYCRAAWERVHWQYSLLLKL